MTCYTGDLDISGDDSIDFVYLNFAYDDVTPSTSRTAKYSNGFFGAQE